MRPREGGGQEDRHVQEPNLLTACQGAREEEEVVVTEKERVAGLKQQEGQEAGRPGGPETSRGVAEGEKEASRRTGSSSAAEGTRDGPPPTPQVPPRPHVPCPPGPGAGHSGPGCPHCPQPHWCTLAPALDLQVHIGPPVTPGDTP